MSYSPFEKVAYVSLSGSQNSIKYVVIAEIHPGDKLFLSLKEDERVRKEPTFAGILYRLNNSELPQPKPLEMKEADPARLSLNLAEAKD